MADSGIRRGPLYRFGVMISGMLGNGLNRRILSHNTSKGGMTEMQVQNWMSSDVVTVDENTSLVQVAKILEESNIRHLPVMRSKKIIGMISDRDVKETLPTRSTTLQAEELYHLLSEVKAKDLMKAEPNTIRPDQTMEIAAVKMLEYRVTGLPVVKEDGELVGIITQGDVFKVLIAITGIYQGGAQFAFNLEDRPGSIKEVADVMREWGGQIVSILSMSDTADEGYRHVFIRVTKVPEGNIQAMTKELDKKFMLLYVTVDPVKDI
jgi:acetoin utilization protein AcuB